MRIFQFSVHCVALVALVCLPAAQSGEESAEEDMPRTAVYEKGGRVGDGAVQQCLKALPEGHKLKVEYHRIFDPSRGELIEYVRVATPLNKDGKADGEELHYQVWRGLVRSVSYKDGVLDGLERTYLHGEGKTFLSSETPWKNGKVDGVKKTFHPNGKVSTEVTYREGVPVGESKSYDPEGRATRVEKFKDGKRHGEATDYLPATGKQKRVVPYEMGKVNGVVKEYYESGKLKSEQPFRQDTLHGVEKHYDTEGNIVKCRYWLDGQLVSKAEFDEKFGK